MWNYNKEDLVEEVKLGGDYISVSGCYDVTIEEIEGKKTKNGADQVVFKFKTDEGSTANIFFVYSNKDGVPTDFKVRQLNQLCGLLKTMPEKLAEMKGKKIGIFLRATGLSKDGKYINWEIDGFYDVKTKGTISEISKKEGVGETYKKAEEKYAKQEAIVPKQVSQSTQSVVIEDDSSDEFPFN